MTITQIQAVPSHPDKYEYQIITAGMPASVRKTLDFRLTLQPAEQNRRGENKALEPILPAGFEFEAGNVQT